MESKQVFDSPIWKNPCLKRIRLQKRSHSLTDCNLSTNHHIESSHISSSNQNVASSRYAKRKNPFKCNELYKRRSSDASDGNLKLADVDVLNNLNLLQKSTTDPTIQKDQCQSVSSLSILPNQSKQSDDSHSQIFDQSDLVKQSSTTIPNDWSIKTKIRFVSTETFEWCANPRSCHTSGGTTDFVTLCQMDKEQGPSKEREFQAALLYWSHPNLPWLRSLPGMIIDNKAKSTGVLDEEMKTALKSDWCDSMASVFHSLRNGHSSYFYVCTIQFTVLFSTEKQGYLQAVISCSTKGLRDALTADGISYTLPLNKSPSINEHDEESLTRSPDDHADDVTPDAWLQLMGIDTNDFTSVQLQHLSMSRDNSRSIDNRQESAILIRDAEVQGFFNFLLNWKSCFAVYGSQAGVPPTILSPSPFKGGTLKTIKYKQTKICSNVSENMCILEISGPILPSNFIRLCSLLSKIQSDFSMDLVPHPSTLVFNLIFKSFPQATDSDSQNLGVVTSHTDGQNSEGDIVLSNTDRQDQVTKQSTSTLRTLKHLEWKSNIYTWMV